MKIMYEDVRHIAKLAALHLSEAEAAAATEDLGNILKLLNQLEAFSIDDEVEPLEQPFPNDSSQAQRPDEARPVKNAEQVLRLAPHAKDNVYLVPKVIE